eukprot:876197-Rhodomonas_salina.1
MTDLAAAPAAPAQDDMVIDPEILNLKRRRLAADDGRMCCAICMPHDAGIPGGTESASKAQVALPAGDHC